MSEENDKLASKEYWQDVGDSEMPGWQVYKAGARPGSWRFRSPAGEHLSSVLYFSRRKMARGGNGIPEPAHISKQPVILDMPESKSGRPEAETKKLGLATPAELALGVTILLIIVTGVLALVGNQPAFAMQEAEARAIATPAGNILEHSVLNRRYGHLLKDGSDYLLLGYALYSYFYRVGTQLNARMPTLPARPQGMTPAPAAVPQGPQMPSAPMTPSTMENTNGSVPRPAAALPFLPSPYAPGG